MTKKEVAYLLGYTECTVNLWFEKAGRQDNEIGRQIKERSKCYSKMKAANFTLTQCLYALSFCDVYNPALRQYLLENFIEHPGETYDRTYFVKFVNEDAAKLVETCSKARIREFPFCCATCGWVSAKQPNKAGCREHPFCNFHDKFVAKMGMNVYKDWCKTYSKCSEYPRLWEPNLPSDFWQFEKLIKNRYRRKQNYSGN